MTWVKGRAGVRKWHGPPPEPDEQELEPVRPYYVPQPGDRIGQDGRELKGRCEDCGRPVQDRSKRCKPCHAWAHGWGQGHKRESPDEAIADVVDRLSRRLTAPAEPTSITKLHALCEDCGCLLAHTNERCPACLVWAERNAAATSWNAATIRKVA